MTQLRSYTRQILRLSHAFIFSFCFITSLTNGAYAAQVISTNTAEVKTTRAPSSGDLQENTHPNLRSNLHQEVNALLAENSRINQEKKSLLESDAQKVFWTQCLVGLMSIFMVVSLFSFWRLHAKAAFNNGLSELSTGLRHFQDSLLSLIDTRQLAHNSVVSSFHSNGLDQDPESLQEHTITKNHLNPNTEQEMSQVKNFVDAWLNVYTPGSSAHDRYLESTKNRPTSPLPWLSMIRGYRQENDQTNFESIRREIKKLFNINVPSWSDHHHDGQKQIADYPHVLNKILELWHSDNVAIYLERLLANSRINGRQGFDITLYENLENLMKLAREPHRPRQLEALKKLPVAGFLFASTEVAATTKTDLSTSYYLAATSEVNTAIVSKSGASSPAIPNPVTVSTAATSVTPSTKVVTETAKMSPLPEPVKSALTNLFEDLQEEPIEDITEDVIEDVLVLEQTSGAQQMGQTETQIQAQIQTQIAPNTALQATQLEEPPSIPAYEVRLKLALAYIDMSDSEGACLLLEDVIKDAPEDQKIYARDLLKTLEEKIAAR